jgi:hypothetical protein
MADPIGGLWNMPLEVCQAAGRHGRGGTGRIDAVPVDPSGLL